MVNDVPGRLRSRRIRPPTAHGVILVLLLLLPLACEELPVEFVGRKTLQPLSLYEEWFGDVAVCMGREDEATPARFDVIQWFSAEEIHDGRLGPHQKIWGNWIAPHEITIRSDALLDRTTVTHELVHDFLQTTGHASPAFQDCAPPCIGVACEP